MRTLVVTGADEAFAPLLRGLVASLLRFQPQPFTALAVFDLGLAPDTWAWVEQHAAHVVTPGWDLPVSEAVRAHRPAWRALTARPFLPDHFPGYDTYLWLDADTWVQRADALLAYLEAAAGGALAAAPEIDRAYRSAPRVMQWRISRLEASFGAGAGRRALFDRYLNAGVFALGAAAPHWRAWRRYFEIALQATSGQLVCDQSALNQAVWEEELALHPMPARMNWLCHLADPHFDEATGLWMEPHAPAEPLGVLHLTSRTKLEAGQAGRRSLRYPGPVPEDVEG